MKNLKLFFLPATLSIALLFGCSKQGPLAHQGIPGQDGSNGNANVTPVTDSTNSSSNWTYNTAGNFWSVSFGNPYLTSSFINSGGFAEVFLSTSGGAVWTPLPSTYYTTDSTLSAQMTYNYSTNSVTINFTWSDLKQLTDPVSTFGATCLFKVVCVEASAVSKKPAQQPGGNNVESVISIPQIRQSQNR